MGEEVPENLSLNRNLPTPKLLAELRSHACFNSLFESHIHHLISLGDNISRQVDKSDRKT
ncbi:MAG: hypothetical protein B6D70_09245 [gamma proteobacterium symbiont of Stewartia floridana]|nr:MAG: hypothetical protein B6D70_09245 [gamma proteobacterium symbiont of Stewartia floridana]